MFFLVFLFSFLPSKDLADTKLAALFSLLAGAVAAAADKLRLGLAAAADKLILGMSAAADKLILGLAAAADKLRLGLAAASFGSDADRLVQSLPQHLVKELNIPPFKRCRLDRILLS